jgi:cyclopropane-fatty-acyl-phospholipid synthase
MWLLDKFLKRVIRHGRLVVTDYDGKVYTYGPAGGAEIRTRLTNKKAAAHIARYPQVGAGEAYMWGWLEIEPPHDIRDLVLFASGEAHADGGDEFRPKSKLAQFVDWAAARADSVNMRPKARRNAEHSYNLTRRLYELFLDEDRQYTMAYYRDTENGLEKAQLDKKAHVAAKMYLKPGMKVLDVGCGWGGFAIYMHKHYGCDVLGVALAPDQIEFCKERARAEGVEDHVKFELKDYRDVEGSFDRISAVGLLEHVGTRHYPEFFQHTNRLLKPQGVMFTHCCGRTSPPGHTDKWTRKYIFPGGYIPALSEIVIEAEKAGWQVMDVEAMRYHYCYTLAEWYERTVMHREQIVDLYDEQFYRMWQFYLAGAEQSFRHNKMVNWHLVYVKDRSAIPMTRDFMYEESARLRDSEQPPVWHLAQAAE